MMKNIFKTVSGKMFLLLLFVHLSNLSFGQEIEDTMGGTYSDDVESNSVGSTEYDEYGADQNQAVLNAMNAFFSAVKNDSEGRSQYSYSMTFNNSGNGFVTDNSTNFGLDVFTNNGQYLDYQNNFDQIAGMYSGLADSQYDYLFNNASIDPVYISSYTNFDHGQFMADVTWNYLDAQDAYGYRDLTRQNIYTFLDMTNSFGTGLTVTGSVLTATGVFSEVGLPLIGLGSSISNASTLGTHLANGYYGTFDPQQAIIDGAFYGAGSVFDDIAGLGTHTGYFNLWGTGSQEWINYMNSLK